jgi:hypothetical protein
VGRTSATRRVVHQAIESLVIEGNDEAACRSCADVHGFTPGGAVHLIVYDRQGDDAYQDVWTVASVETYGPSGSADPAQGFAKGGVVRHLFSFVVEPVSGPNGSQDPAYGFSRADAQVNSPEDGQDLTVRAYDVQSQTWSNVLDARVFTPAPAQAATTTTEQAPQCQSPMECQNAY